jgi:isoquinoline 1-oxidoreductase alpha subunit
MQLKLSVNGRAVAVDVDPDTPLLWVVREQLGLTGTKFGCGIGLCGACTVALDGEPVPSCALPAAAAQGKAITTIEGLSGARSEALRRAWVQEQVPQCGYCQSGMLMAAEALLRRTPKPTRADIEQAMTNLCRCGTYARVARAIERAARELS